MAANGPPEREHLLARLGRWFLQYAGGFFWFLNNHTERPEPERPEIPVEVARPQREDGGGVVGEQHQNVRPPSHPIQRVPPLNIDREMGQQGRIPVYLPEEAWNYDNPFSCPCGCPYAQRSAFPYAPPPHPFNYPPPPQPFEYPPPHPFAYPPPRPFEYPPPRPFAYPPPRPFEYPPPHPFAYPPPQPFEYPPPHPFAYPPPHPFNYPPPPQPFNYPPPDPFAYPPPHSFAQAPPSAFDYAPPRAFAPAPHAFAHAPPPAYLNGAPNFPPQAPPDDYPDAFDHDPVLDHDPAAGPDPALDLENDFSDSSEYSRIVYPEFDIENTGPLTLEQYLQYYRIINSLQEEPQSPSTSGLGSSRRSREETEEEEAPPTKRLRWSDESDSN